MNANDLIKMLQKLWADGSISADEYLAYLGKIETDEEEAETIEAALGNSAESR